MKITSKELRYYIDKNNIQNIYLFAGPEIGEKKEIINLIEKKIFQNNTPVKYTFYCDENLDNADLIDTLSTGLLFSEKKIVILKAVEGIHSSTVKSLEKYIIPAVIDEKNFDETKHKALLKYYEKEKNYYKLKDGLKKKDKTQLLILLKDNNLFAYNKDAYLIMVNETSDKIPDELTDLILPEQNIMFWEMFDSQKTDWIRNEFKKNNLYINNDAIEFILDMIPNNKEQLGYEIIKISSLYEEKGGNSKNLIDRAFIEDYLYFSKEETAFSLYSIMLEGDIGKALIILNNVFNTDEYGLLNGLVWSHRRFIKALDMYENQKIPVNDIFLNLRILSKRNQEEFKKGFQKYRFYNSTMLFHNLSELDYYLKVLPDNLKLIKLQEFVINFINCNDNSFLQGELQTVQE